MTAFSAIVDAWFIVAAPFAVVWTLVRESNKRSDERDGVS